MISNSGHDENGRYSGGISGDQTGTEWQIIPWYNRPWNYVLRHPDRNVGNMISELAVEAANNNNIGYDQANRRSFWSQLSSSGYRPANIKSACEADCSSGVAAIVKATGYLLGLDKLKNVSADMYTGNERAALKSAGFEVLTDSKYLTSDKYLYAGDILLYEGHHTAINITDGSEANDVSGETKMTKDKLFAAAKTADRRTYSGGYTYGDAQTWNGTDLTRSGVKTVSCDRGVAMALYIAGYTDIDPAKMVLQGNVLGATLTAKGWTRINSLANVQPGDIVFYDNDRNRAIDWRDHVFIVGDAINKRYDWGSNARIKHQGGYSGGMPFTESINGSKFLYALRMPSAGSDGYPLSWKTVNTGDKNTYAYIGTTLLKGRGCKGVYKNGKRQDLELNFEWTKGDRAAVYDYCQMRAANGTFLACDGSLTLSIWNDLTGGLKTAEYFDAATLNNKTFNGSVFVAQTLLKGRGMDKALELDGIAGPKTSAAVKKFKKAVNLSDDSKCDYSFWKNILGGIGG